MPKKKLFLVGSSVARRKKACVAARMYYNKMFELAREYVEKRGDKWFILSAYHLLLEPGFTIWPYDETMDDLDDLERAEWGTVISKEIGHYYDSDAFEVVVLAECQDSKELVGFLKDLGFKTSVPLAGMTIKEKYEWLKEKTDAIESYPLICVQCDKPVPSYDKTDLLGLLFHPDCFGKRNEHSNRQIGLKLAKEIVNGIDYFKMQSIRALLIEPEFKGEDEFEDELEDDIPEFMGEF